MKNQYVGDINDYHKYGMLRCLSRCAGWHTLVAWMLTPDDGRSDGRHTAYLRAPGKWRDHDPVLFDALYELVAGSGRRSVRALQARGILPDTRFYGRRLADEPSARQRYFARLWAQARGAELIFFDPDNGLAVRSVPYGRRGASRYLYPQELNTAFARGHSLLVYQHFPRVAREAFIRCCTGRIFAGTGARELYALQTPRVVFFLVPQPAWEPACQQALLELDGQWPGRFRIQRRAARP